jgi:hypothetical protein
VGNTLSDNNAAVKKFENSGYDMEQVKRYVGSLLYWGHQPFTSGPVYVGAGVFFLFVFSFFVVRSNFKWALLAITLFAVFLSFGKNTPFFGWMFNLLPFFNKFRTPAMALVIAQLTIPLLGIMGLHELITGKISTDELLKKLKNLLWYFSWLGFIGRYHWKLYIHVCRTKRCRVGKKQR